MGKGTELEIKQNSFLAPNGLYNLKTIKATPWGGLDYRFNAKGRDMKGNNDLFSVQGKTITDVNGELMKELTIQIIGFNLIDCQKQILFSEEHESTKLWCEVMFLDENKAISSIFIKTHSLDNLKNYAVGLQLGAKTRHMKEVLTTIFAVEMTHAKYGMYYVLDFKQSGEVSKEVVLEVDELFEPDNELGVKVLTAAARYPNNVKIIPRTEA